MNTKPKKIWGCTLGNCIHVAGIHRFFRLAREHGYETCFAGTGLPVAAILEALQTEKPDFMALSYRLTPNVAKELLALLWNELKKGHYPRTVWLFGGTPPVCDVAANTGLFSSIFNGMENEDEVIRWLKGDLEPELRRAWADSLIPRMRDQRPYPILRHHFGLPDLEATIAGVKTIAESKVVDVISIGPDQNAQEFFFHPERMDPLQTGAGGVPLRRVEDLRRIYAASRHGNHPLLRIYSGTNDLLAWAELSVRELNNAWAAIPLYWYSVLDGRSRRGLEEAITENQAAMAWYGKRDIPVEVNEAHHWSLRDAPDEVAVAAAYLAAYNAKTQGVKDFILQMMWNTPPQILPYQDLAKMLAKLEMVQLLADDRFRVWREVRAGLASLAPQADLAKGQLAVSTLMAVQVKPDIVHVVGFCEGDHAATPAEVIESCRIVRGVLRNGLNGWPDMALDTRVTERKQELLDKAYRIIETIINLGGKDSLTNPVTLAEAVRQGLIYAPQMIGPALSPK
jgi:hypothetical protein